MPHKRAKRSEREKNGTQMDQAPGGARSKNELSNEDIPKGAMRALNAAKVQEEYRKRKMQGDGPGSEGSAKKRRKTTGEDFGKGEKGGKERKGNAMKIQPGESLAHFNRRVEENMRPLLRDAMQASAAVTRRTKKEEEALKEAEKAAKAKSTSKSKKQPSNGEKAANTDEDEADLPAPGPSQSKVLSKPVQPKERATEFVGLKTSAPRRLNDIVMAPPELKKLPRGAKSVKTAKAEGAPGAKTLREGVLSMAQKAMLEQERERVIVAYREMKKRGAGP